MSNIAIKAENLSKAYQLGDIGTGTISRDVERWYARIRGKEDPFLRIGETNNRSVKGTSDVVWSLKDVSFEIEQGDTVGIIGRNGAGKSTLLKILSKVTAPTTGKISGKGRIASLLEVGTGFHPELSGRENIFLNGAILGMRKKEIVHKLDEIVDFAGIERYIDTPVKRYSSGMYVRLAFAVAAHLESEILIVDEVLAVGDAEFQKKCLGKMNEVSNTEGRTVLFVSHNMSAIRQLCKKSILLSNGEMVAQDFTQEIIKTYHLQGNRVQSVDFEDGYVASISANYSDGELTIKCKYRDFGSFKSPFLGFIVSDIYNNKIYGSNPKLNPPEKKFEHSNAGIVVATINSPKLLAGNYYISIWLGDGDDDYFAKENILSFEVDEVSTIMANGNEQGYVIPELKWSHEKD